MSTVLLTGGSGFVGSHIILQLLEARHVVRTTVRLLQREADVRAMLEGAGAQPGDRLAFLAADLERDDGWAESLVGCEYVLHVASPMPPVAPKTEAEVIIPARDGVLRVLRAARDAKVKRVVLTSSCGAIYYGHPLQNAPFDETSWTNVDGEMSAYVKSKAIAERAAWDFVAAEGGRLELAVVNPAGIFGPALGADYSPSLDLVKRLMNGMPGCPQLYFGVVDVRDVADLHLRAMTSPAARGERFIAVAGECMSMLDIAKALKARLGDSARKVPTRQLPNWVVRLAARFDPAMQQLLPLLGKIRNATSEKSGTRSALDAALARRGGGRHRREPAEARNRQLGSAVIGDIGRRSCKPEPKLVVVWRNPFLVHAPTIRDADAGAGRQHPGRLHGNLPT